MKKKQTYGGRRPGGGRKPIADPKKSFAVYLRKEEREQLISQYGSLTVAIESLLNA